MVKARIYVVVYTLFITLAIFSIYIPLLVKPSEESASPYNNRLFGTTELVSLIRSHGYDVVIVNSVYELADISGKHVVLILVAPDIPYTPSELDFLRKYSHEKKLSLLIADEIGIMNNITEKLLGIRVYGELIRDTGLIGSGWEDFVKGRCRVGNSLYNVLFSRASTVVTEGAGAKLLCIGLGRIWADLDWDMIRDPGEPYIDNPVIGVYGYYDGGKYVVIADSSIFTNYMIDGYRGIPSTKNFVLGVIEWLADGGNTVFVIDNSRYVARENTGAKVLVLFLSTPVIVVKLLGLVLWNIGLKNILLISMFTALIPSILLYKPLRIRVGKYYSYIDESRAKLASESIGLGRILGDEYLVKLAGKAWRKKRIVNKLVEYISRLERRGAG